MARLAEQRNQMAEELQREKTANAALRSSVEEARREAVSVLPQMFRRGQCVRHSSAVYAVKNMPPGHYLGDQTGRGLKPTRMLVLFLDLMWETNVTHV